MRVSTRLLSSAVAAAVVFSVAGCAASPGGTPSNAQPSGIVSPVIAPVTLSAQDLQGATVELLVGQSLNITTGDLAGDSYRGTVSDGAVAEFVPGGTRDGAQFNPGITALAVGTTTVVLSHTDGGIQNVTFTVNVTGR